MAERAPGAVQDGTIFDFGAVNPEVYEGSCESLIGQVAIPVGIVGPLTIHHREYEEDEAGNLVDQGTTVTGSFYIPMATHEGGLSATLDRGIRAANACGGVNTYVLNSLLSQGCGYVFETNEHAYTFSRWLESSLPRMRAWLEDPENPLRDTRVQGIPLLSRNARLRAVETYLVSSTCHTLFRYTTGDACGQNMTRRSTYMLQAHFVLPRFRQDTGIEPSTVFFEADVPRDSRGAHFQHAYGGHGKSVMASLILTEKVLAEFLQCSIEEAMRLRDVGCGWSAPSGMVGVTCNPASVIAAIFAATGQDLACVGSSSAALASAAECPDGLHCTLRLPALEVGTVGGGTGLPHQSRYLEIMQCTGPNTANRFAQIVTAAAICLELASASAMAAAGSGDLLAAGRGPTGDGRARRPAKVSRVLIDRLREDASE